MLHKETMILLYKETKGFGNWTEWLMHAFQRCPVFSPMYFFCICGQPHKSYTREHNMSVVSSVRSWWLDLLHFERFSCMTTKITCYKYKGLVGGRRNGGLKYHLADQPGEVRTWVYWWPLSLLLVSQLSQHSSSVSIKVNRKVDWWSISALFVRIIVYECSLYLT